MQDAGVMMEVPPDWSDVPPHDAAPEPAWSRECEQSLLGCLLMDSACMAHVSQLVDEDSFYELGHRRTYAAVVDLLAQRVAVDPVTVLQRLREVGDDEVAGGLAYLHQLAVCVPSTANAAHYAGVVAEKAAERRWVAALAEAARIGSDDKLTLAARQERVAETLRRAEPQNNSVAGRRVPLLSLAQLEDASAAIRWLVKHVVPADSIGMLFGGSGTFKSFIALDAALHVAHGLPWMGRKTTKGPVVYIAAEGGAGLWSRIKAWHKQRGLRPSDAQVYVVPAAVDLTQDAWRVVEAAQLVGVAPLMVVVDTLSQTYAGEENSANEMAAYLRELGARFRQLWACTVLLIHHSGHQATERPRGSSAIRSNIDFLLGAFRDEKEMLATLSCIKQKDGELFDDSCFRLTVEQLGFDEDNDAVTSLVARHLSTEDELREAQEAEQAAGRGGRQQGFMLLVQNGMPEKELRKVFYDGLLDLDAEARRKAYNRARATAVARGEIEIAEGYVIDLRGMKKGARASR